MPNPAIQVVPIDQVHLNDDNPRLLKDARFEQLVKSIEEFPEMLNLRPLVIDEAGIVLGGNMRLRALQHLGYTEVPVMRALDLSEEQKREFIIKDNGSFGEWDWDALANGDWPEASVLNDWGISLPPDWGPVVEAAPAEEPDANPFVPQAPITVPGDLYELNEHRLQCADSTDSDAVSKLMDGKLADLIFTDPPYGVSFQSGWGSDFEVLENDDTILEVAPVIWLFMKDNTAAFIWTSHHVYPEWREQFDSFYKQTIIWYKHGGGIGDLEGSYALDYEMALFCVKGRPSLRGTRGAAVWEIAKDAPGRYEHPTQKPTALAERAMADFSDAEAVVLDLFLGSGSTLIACEMLGRYCYGQEKEPAFCDVAIRRWMRYMRDNERSYQIKRNGTVLTEKKLAEFIA